MGQCVSYNSYNANSVVYNIMIVSITGPKGGKLDIEFQAYALMLIRNFTKQLNIHRLKIHLQVNVHKGIYVDKAKTCEGLCEALDDRNFVIDVALYSNWVSTLAHELVHVKQFARHELNESLTHWKNKNYSKTEYWDQPWEKEARKLQRKLVQTFEDE